MLQTHAPSDLRPLPPEAPRLQARARFTRDDFERAERVLLARGGWPKSAVWKVQIDGRPWVVKDFRPRGFLTRNSIGRLLVSREARALGRLDGLPGVPAGGFRIDRHALAYRFAVGRPLSTLRERDQPVELFRALERALQAIHARGIVHLDVRNRRNILVTEGGEPLLIDFESHLDTAGWPSWARTAVERFDLGSAYKHWAKARRETLGEERERLFLQMNRWRRLWIFRGVRFFPREARKLANRLLVRLGRREQPRKSP